MQKQTRRKLVVPSDPQGIHLPRTHRIVTDGLVSWWDFRGGYATDTLIDRIGGNDGTITNADAGVFWADGKGQGIFDGVDEVVDVGDNSDFDITETGRTTISVWFFHADSNRAGLVGKTDV